MFHYLFLFFIFLTIISGIMVLIADNAINAVLCLIGCFINSAILLLMCGFDFFALVFVAIYVSVIAVLFLCILIFLNIPYYKYKFWHIRLLRLGIGFILFFWLFSTIVFPELQILFYLQPVQPKTILNFWVYTNSLEIIAALLYTTYAIYILLAAIILFFAMLGSIMLLQQYQFNWNTVFKNRVLKVTEIIASRKSSGN